MPADISRHLASVFVLPTDTAERTVLDRYTDEACTEAESTMSPDRIKLTHYAASESDARLT